MSGKILKGILQNCNSATKYDDDGNAYKLYSFKIGGQSLTAKTPDGVYLDNGMELVLALAEGSDNQVVAGFCAKNGTKWGSNVRSLKKEVSPTDHYEFVTGEITEKRKNVSATPDPSREYYGASISYTIILGERRFNASAHLGGNLKPGMHIAAVLENNEAVLVMDQTTKKMRGNAKPYYLLLTAMLIAFNATMYYLYATDQTHVINFKMVLIVINVFLVLFTALSVAVYVKSNAAKAFLRSNLRG